MTLWAPTSQRATAFAAVFVLSLLVPAPAISQDEPVTEGGVYYGCGKPQPIARYELNFRGTQLSLPSYVTIKRGESTLFSDPSPTRWQPPYTSARYAAWGDTLLVLTTSNDCVDLQERRLFIVRKDGHVVHQRVWTSNWKDGFFVEGGVLAYWSDWFCQPENNERPAGKSFIYAFSEKKLAFERVVADEAKYCTEPPVARFLKFRAFRVAE